MMFKLKPFFVLSILVVILAVSVTIYNTDHYKVVKLRLTLTRNYPLLKYLVGLFRKPGKEIPISGTGGSPFCVRWLAPFLSGGGYCTEAWSYILALEGNENVRLSIEQHGDSLNVEFWEGLPEEMRNLGIELHQTKCRLNETIIVCHSEPGAWFPPLFETLPCPDIGYGNYRIVIGRTMFETDRVNAHHVERCNRMDYVWVPTDFHVNTFVESGVDPSKVVKIVQPVDGKFFDPVKYKPFNLQSKGTLVLGSRSANSKADKNFVFLSVFKWEHRKGWDVLLRSYLKEFSKADAVALYLLTNPYYTENDFGNKILEFVEGSDLQKPAHGWAPVYVIDRHIAQINFPRIYKAADAFVLPSRGEGWGRPIVEAMAMSLPVIVTNWSGPTEYMTMENSYPLPVERMSEVMEGPFQGHLWAEPSTNKLQNLMRHVISNPEEAKAKGRQAREDMIKRFSPEIVAGIVRDHVQQILEKTL